MASHADRHVKSGVRAVEGFAHPMGHGAGLPRTSQESDTEAEAEAEAEADAEADADADAEADAATGFLASSWFPRLDRVVGRLRVLWVVAFACGCAARAPATTVTVASAPVAPVPTAAAPSVVVAVAPEASAPPAPTTPPPPKVVLHAGDSMVGGAGGLAQALDSRYFGPLGAKYVRDWRVATVQTFDYQNYFGKLLEKHHPDMVILNLGANDVFVPNPKALARFVASIAKKASADGRTCYWITPPLWKPPDTGIVEVIKANATGCTVFDSSALVLPKWPDGIHPNNQGGAIWAEKFWDFYVTSRRSESH